MNFLHKQIILWTGVSLAIGLGVGGHYVLGIAYPLNWLMWLPGWTIEGYGMFLAFRRSERK